MPPKKSDFLVSKRSLQRFQSDRLNRTYTDLKNDPRYVALGDFFFNRLYAPKDFTFRDTGIKKLQQVLAGRIHQPMTSAMQKVIELHELSDALDDRMVYKMIETGVGPKLTLEDYRAVYRQLDNNAQRVHQIELTVEATQIFHGLSQKWIVAVSLKTATMAARLIGMGDMMDFIHEGYMAFRKIRSIDHFSNTIFKREMAWHHELWDQAIK